VKKDNPWALVLVKLRILEKEKISKTYVINVSKLRE
jgi:hypothetical protein